MDELKKLREANGLSQDDLARLAGTSQPQIKRLENGERKLTKEWAIRLAGPKKPFSPCDFLCFRALSINLIPQS